MTRIHKPSLGPYSEENIRKCLHCGKLEPPINEECKPPTLGRMVHYNVSERLDEQPFWYAAIVVHEEPLTLRVLDPDTKFNSPEPVIRGTKGGKAVRDYNIEPNGEGEAPGCWRWPPRVE